MPDVEALSILVIDDSESDFGVAERYLLRDPDQLYALVRAETAAEGEALFRELRPDGVVLDFRLPDGDGLALLDELGKTTEVRPLPVVFTTGQGSEDVAADAIRRGAADYLVKGEITPVRLRIAVKGAVERHRQAREQRALRRAFVYRVERERRDLQHRWLGLADNLPDGLLVVADGLVHYANDAARDLLGDILVGASFWDGVPAGAHDAIRSLWERGEAGTIEHALADGRRVAHLAIPIVEGDDRGVQILLRPLSASEPAPSPADNAG